MKGRKPVPTALKILRGNPGKRALNNQEPELPAPASLEPPQPLGGEGRREWDRLVPMLVNSGVLTEADMTPFWLYCWTVGEVARLRAKVDRLEPEEAHELGYTRAMGQLADRAAKMASEFGLTSVSRSRVKATKPTDEGDEKRKRFFGGTAG